MQSSIGLSFRIDERFGTRSWRSSKSNADAESSRPWPFPKSNRSSDTPEPTRWNQHAGTNTLGPMVRKPIFGRLRTDDVNSVVGGHPRRVVHAKLAIRRTGGVFRNRSMDRRAASVPMHSPRRDSHRRRRLRWCRSSTIPRGWIHPVLSKSA